MSLDDELRTLKNALAKCGPNATAILVRQAERLTMGAEQYGADFDDARDLLPEWINELSDGTSYAGAIELRGEMTPRLEEAREHQARAYMLLQAELTERNNRAVRATIPEAAE